MSANELISIDFVFGLWHIHPHSNSLTAGSPYWVITSNQRLSYWKRHNWNFPIANRILWNFIISYLFVLYSTWKLIIQKICLWISVIKKLPLTILIPNNILKISTIPPKMVHFYFTSITLPRSKCCKILHILKFL